MHTHTEAHSRFYILKRIFLATLKIGISAQHWRQAIFYRPRKKMGWETVPAETHGQNQNGNRSEPRRRSSLGLSVLCECVFCSFSQLSCVFIICQTSISGSGSSSPSQSLPHSASVVGLGASTRVSHVRVYINLCA